MGRNVMLRPSHDAWWCDEERRHLHRDDQGVVRLGGSLLMDAFLCGSLLMDAFLCGLLLMDAFLYIRCISFPVYLNGGDGGQHQHLICLGYRNIVFVKTYHDTQQ